MERYDLLVIGGGAAGMAAAAEAADHGASVALAEAEPRLGGILLQCLHLGFGQTLFGEAVSGPVYAAWWDRRVRSSGAAILTEHTAVSLEPDCTALLSGPAGVRRVGFRRCILATGCYERTIGSLPIGGTRPAGVFSAGTAQALTNLGHYSVGSRIVVLGSGDVGQIMARQFVQAGKTVVCLVEQRDALGGLARNRRDCVEAYRIPVLLRSTVDELLGEGRLRGVMVRSLETGQRREVSCDTLVTAIGLLPDRTLCRGLGTVLPEWLQVCGNCDYVHELVELAVKDARAAAAAACRAGF